jgi:exonuclease SbcD
VKILHFADLHLGVENYGRINPQSGLSTRLEDFLRSFDELADYAIEQKVDLVLFCGDAYKTREPTQTQQREFAKRVNRIALAGIPVFLLTGNHDMPNAAGRATATEIFDTLAVHNVTVAGKPGISVITTPSGDVQVAALPWLRRAALLGRDADRNLPLDKVKEHQEQTLAGIVTDMAEKLDPAVPSILAAHVSLAMATVGSESMMSLGQEPALLTSNVANPAFDYVALGHIHKRQELHDRAAGGPPVIYAGSLERVDFGEEKDEKGFYVVEIAAGATAAERTTTYEFHPVRARRFSTVSVKLTGEELDPTAAILEAVNREKKAVNDAIVRLNIELPVAAQGPLRDAELREALGDAAFARITVAREQPAPPAHRVLPSDSRGTPLKALEAWLGTQEMSDARRAELLDYARKLIDSA